MFWSDQYDRRIQFVGHAPAACEIELDLGAGERRGTARAESVGTADASFVAWIRQNELPVAAMLVNRPDALGRARLWIADAGSEETRRAA